MKARVLGLLVAGGLFSGCASLKAMEHRFVPLDESYEFVPRDAAAKVLVNEDEINAVPPFKFVGVLEIEGKETDRLGSFVQRVARVGGAMGCDVVVERDAFEGGQRVKLYAGRVWHRNDRAIWQFLCGVNGATPEEQLTTMRQATATAVAMRWEQMGKFEPCQPFTPTGSHVRKFRVCAEDPGHHSEADSRVSAR